MPRKNPTYTTSSKNLAPVFEGIDNLPNPIGKNMDVQEKGNEMPEVSMKKNDGDNPSYGDAPFANGDDGLSHSGGPKSNPTPAKPGA
jgi:hypothetical protein